jgi:hypothetical protein
MGFFRGNDNSLLLAKSSFVLLVREKLSEVYFPIGELFCCFKGACAQKFLAIIENKLLMNFLNFSILIDLKNKNR